MTIPNDPVFWSTWVFTLGWIVACFYLWRYQKKYRSLVEDVPNRYLVFGVVALLCELVFFAAFIVVQSIGLAYVAFLFSAGLIYFLLSWSRLTLYPDVPYPSVWIVRPYLLTMLVAAYAFFFLALVPAGIDLRHPASADADTNFWLWLGSTVIASTTTLALGIFTFETATSGWRSETLDVYLRYRCYSYALVAAVGTLYYMSTLILTNSTYFGWSAVSSLSKNIRDVSSLCVCVFSMIVFFGQKYLLHVYTGYQRDNVLSWLTNLRWLFDEVAPLYPLIYQGNPFDGIPPIEDILDDEATVLHLFTVLISNLESVNLRVLRAATPENSRRRVRFADLHRLWTVAVTPSGARSVLQKTKTFNPKIRVVTKGGSTLQKARYYARLSDHVQWSTPHATPSHTPLRKNKRMYLS